VERPSSPAPQMLWNGWGDPARAAPVPDAVITMLEQGLGIRAPAAPAVELDQVSVAPARIPGAAREALEAAVGPDQVHDDDETRVRHTRGKSTPDLLRLRAGEAADAPDAVVLPASHDEVLAVLAACAAHRVAVVPFGGGSSVVGGLAPAREGFDAVIALDLARMDGLVSVDAESRTAVLEPGLRGPQAEALLEPHGFTIGHFPQSFQYATIGGFAAARSSGQSSAGYGRFDELVVGLRLATPEGAIELGTAPKSAAGPDLRQLVLGSEGAFGVITAVNVRLRPVPEATVYEGWRFASFAEGAAALRSLVQDGPLPTVLRLSDEFETAVNLARPDEVGAADGPAGCLALVGFEGTESVVASRRAEAATALTGLGGEPLGTEPGDGWAHGRYDGPYLRDALLAAGALVETLETVTFWSNVPRLYAAVRDALTESLAGQGTQPIVLCHISHVYETGASLYFTVASAQAEDPVAQWRAAKAAASEAIIEAGASITHHHAVGTDHRDWYEREIGALAIGALRAVKDRLDPAGIMNPGVLIP
jgi:alkyldihydroxyacetonephosphate synthase